MGAAIAIFRRTARSCAAPFARQAAHRSSKLEASGCVVDIAHGADATPVGSSMAMGPSHNGFGEGWAGMAEGSEKQELKYIPIALGRSETLPLNVAPAA